MVKYSISNTDYYGQIQKIFCLNGVNYLLVKQLKIFNLNLIKNETNHEVMMSLLEFEKFYIGYTVTSSSEIISQETIICKCISIESVSLTYITPCVGLEHD